MWCGVMRMQPSGGIRCTNTPRVKGSGVNYASVLSYPQTNPFQYSHY